MAKWGPILFALYVLSVSPILPSVCHFKHLSRHDNHFYPHFVKGFTFFTPMIPSLCACYDSCAYVNITYPSLHNESAVIIAVSCYKREARLHTMFTCNFQLNKRMRFEKHRIKRYRFSYKTKLYRTIHSTYM